MWVSRHANVDLEHGRNAIGPTMIEADDSIAAMEGRDPPGEICYQRRRERSSSRHVVEQSLLREATHLHHGVDETPRPGPVVSLSRA
jgi:hypothetical protein